MQAILYVGHGSRVDAGNEQFQEFIQKVKEQIRLPIQETAFLEKANPTVQVGIENCIEKGATQIAIIPVLLLAASHVKGDLPNAIEQAKKRFPKVTITYGRPIGPDIAVIDILIDLLKEQKFIPRNIEERENIAVLLVGRGSSDPQANSDLVKISRMLWELCPVDTVEYCFLAATRPNFQEGLEKALALKYKKVIVLPYLLFTGVLMKRMEKTIEAIQKETEKTIVLSNYLGYHPKLIEIIRERTYEALNGNNSMSCDSCMFRLHSNGK